MNPIFETVKAHLAKSLVVAFESCQQNDKLSTLTDLYIQVNETSKEVAVYNDDEDLLTQFSVDNMSALIADESLFVVFETLVREVTEDAETLDKLHQFDILKPFSLLLVDESFEQQAEVYLLEPGDLVIEDSLFKDINKELDDFLDHLLKE